MLDVTFAGWAATIGLIAAPVRARSVRFAARPCARPSASAKRSLASVFYVSVAIAFGVVFGLIAGWDFGAEYFAGYIVEKSLSVDNLFVFVVIMSAFAVPPEHQQRVLTFGILVALLMRGVFIALGAALISAFSFMFLIFGLLLLVTAIQLFRHRDEDPDVDENVLVRLTKRVIPVTPDYAGGRLFHPSGRSPGRDPAVHRARSRSAVPTCSSRSTRSRLCSASPRRRSSSLQRTPSRCSVSAPCTSSSPGLLDRLVYLSTGLSLILAFIGVKLLLHWGHLQNDRVPEVATSTSLLVILGVLAVTVVASVMKAKRDPTIRAHAGSLRERREPARRDR